LSNQEMFNLYTKHWNFNCTFLAMLRWFGGIIARQFRGSHVWWLLHSWQSILFPANNRHLQTISWPRYVCLGSLATGDRNWESRSWLWSSTLDSGRWTYVLCRPIGLSTVWVL